MAAQAIASNLSRPHPTDSRLLQNLIKSEKSYVEALSTSVQYAHGASSALSAWGTSEAPDIASASDALSEMLNAVADAQRTHVQAIDGYRSALKDVLDREQSIRSVVRDRDILVGRLIKASKKKPTKREIALGGGASAEEKSERVAEAQVRSHACRSEVEGHIQELNLSADLPFLGAFFQRELHACEAVLASEEAALVGVKRRTFKEALTMRMKTMGDAGAAMVDAARDAILLLDQVDTQGRMPAAPTLHEQFASEDLQEGTFSQQRQDPAHSTEEELREEAERKGLMPDGYGGYRAPWEGKFGTATRRPVDTMMILGFRREPEILSTRKGPCMRDKTLTRSPPLTAIRRAAPPRCRSTEPNVGPIRECIRHTVAICLSGLQAHACART